MATLLAACLWMALADPAERPCLLIVTGAAGAPQYKPQFDRWAGLWQSAGQKAGAETIWIGQAEGPGATDRERLRQILLEKSNTAREPLWIVLIGHGTYDGREAKFNLRGP